MSRSTILFALPSALLFGALCAGALCEQDPEQVCEPGRVDDCPCVGGVDGVQVCDDDGAGWGDCECGDDEPDAGPEDGPDAGPEGCDGDVVGALGSPECDACAACATAGPCATEVEACNDTPECATFQSCLTACPEGDDTCLTACDTSYPTGRALHVALYQCVLCVECQMTCDATSLACQ